MTQLFQIGLANVLAASILALLAGCVSRWGRRPALAHGLWVLVLLKLVTPPMVTIPFLPPLALTSSPPAPSASPTGEQPSLEGVGSLFSRPKAPEQANPTIGAAKKDSRPPNDREAEIPQPSAAVATNLDTNSPADIVPEPASAAQLTTDSPVPAAANAPPLVSPLPLGSGYFLLIVWLAGSLLWFGVAVRRMIGFDLLLKLGTPVSADVRREAEDLAGRFGVRCPEVVVAAGAVSPLLWAWGRKARLVLPAGLLERLGAEQRAALIAHELAHWRRRDHWVRFLELIVTGVYWWCPLVWWARRELQQAEEECCDAWVVWALPGAGRAYALALVETLDFLAEVRHPLPSGASGIGHVKHLQRRLTMILGGNTPRRLTLLGGLVLVGAGFVLLPMLPTWAQEPETRVPKDAELNKVRMHIKKMADELARRRAELDEQRAALEKQANELQEAIHRLKVAEEQGEKDGKKKFQGPGDFKSPYGKPGPGPQPGDPMGGPMPKAKPGFAGKPGSPGMPGLAPSDLQRRLEEIEDRLVGLLHDVHHLRKTLGEGGPRPGFPGKGPQAAHVHPPQPPVPPTAPVPGIIPKRPIAPVAPKKPAEDEGS